MRNGFSAYLFFLSKKNYFLLLFVALLALGKEVVFLNEEILIVLTLIFFLFLFYPLVERVLTTSLGEYTLLFLSRLDEIFYKIISIYSNIEKVYNFIFLFSNLLFYFFVQLFLAVVEDFKKLELVFQDFYSGLIHLNLFNLLFILRQEALLLLKKVSLDKMYKGFFYKMFSNQNFYKVESKMLEEEENFTTLFYMNNLRTRVKNFKKRRLRERVGLRKFFFEIKKLINFFEILLFEKEANDLSFLTMHNLRFKKRLIQKKKKYSFVRYFFFREFLFSIFNIFFEDEGDIGFLDAEDIEIEYFFTFLDKK